MHYEEDNSMEEDIDMYNRLIDEQNEEQPETRTRTRNCRKINYKNSIFLELPTVKSYNIP